MVLNIYNFMAFIAIFVIIYLIVRLYNKNAIKKDNILGKRLSEILLIAISLAFGVIFIPIVYLVTIDEIHITKGDVYIKYLEVEQVSLKNKDLTIKNSNDYKIKINLEKNELDVYHNDKKEDGIPTKRYIISKDQLEAIKNKDKFLKTLYLFHEDGSLDNVYVKIVNKETIVKDFDITY